MSIFNLQARRKRAGEIFLDQVLRYVQRFMQSYHLFPPSKRAVVAVSCGVDSMVLLWILQTLKDRTLLKSVEVIFVDHGTRDTIEDEWNLLDTFCKERDISLHREELKLSLEMSNFENIAREERRRIYRSYHKEGDFIFTGHHLDDSFEWSLMQRFKSSDPRKSKGIPVRNTFIARPLLCLSKDHILRIAQYASIPYKSDLSNGDTSFERNYIRKNIIPQIKARYPSYLKNYVAQSLQSIESSIHHLKIHHYKTGSVLRDLSYKHNFFRSHSLIYDIIYHLSNVRRGTLREQIKKMISMEKNGVGGPLTFSGDVIGYSIDHILYFTKKVHLEHLEGLDERWSVQIQNLITNNQVKRCSLSEYSFENVSFPYFVMGRQDDLEKISIMKKEHPLFPRTWKTLVNNNLWCQYYSKLYNIKKDLKIEVLLFEGFANE